MKLCPAIVASTSTMLLAAAPAAGQSAFTGPSVAIPISAVVGSPVNVSALTPLDFTVVYPGLVKTVSPVAGGAFSISGHGGAEVVVAFDLPPSGRLQSGANALVVDSWTGCFSQTSTTAGCTTFVPSSLGITTRLSSPGNGNGGTNGNGGGNGNAQNGSLYLWIGATVRPAVTQPAGSYSATVTMTAAYTGL